MSIIILVSLVLTFIYSIYSITYQTANFTNILFCFFKPTIAIKLISLSFASIVKLPVEEILVTGTWPVFELSQLQENSIGNNG